MLQKCELCLQSKNYLNVLCEDLVLVPCVCDAISPHELQLHCFTKLMNVWVDVGQLQTELNI